MRAWIIKKFWEPLLTLLKQGLSPSKLALTVALGAYTALFPALGVTTILATGIALGFRLNLVAMLTANYAAYPLQFVVLFPFFRAGEWLFDRAPLGLSPMEFVSFVTQNPSQAVRIYWTVTWDAAAVWLLAGALVVPLLWFILTPVFTRVAQGLETQRV